MACLFLLQVKIFMIVATLVWSLSKYRDGQAQWRARRELLPRSRPVLLRAIMRRAAKG